MGRISQLPDNLPQLQNLVKRDPECYEAEFVQQYERYEANLQVFLLQPNEDAKQLCDLIMFIAQVSHRYPKLVKDFPQQLREVLQRHADTLNHEVRTVICRALMLLRRKNIILPAPLIELFFELFRCHDKQLRQMLFIFITRDIKFLNKTHKNNKLNKGLQNYMYTMLSDSNGTAAHMSLRVMNDLYHRKIWNDAKTVNVITTACFSKNSKVVAAALRFFLGQDYLDDKPDEDSDSAEEGPSSRDIIMRFAVNKKNPRTKLKKKKALQKLAKKSKKKHQKPNFDFSAIQLLYDPDGFAEKLFKQVAKSRDRFEIRLMMILVISRVIGLHDLFLLNFYPFLHRFLQPHQREVTKILLAVAQASHELVPPEIIREVIMTIANNFVTERNSSEVMAVGINAIREISARCPLSMTDDLLQDLTQYKAKHGKTVTTAARSLIQLFRKIDPSLLYRKDRGRPTEATSELKVAAYGEVVSHDYVPGSEVLSETVQEEEGYTKEQDGYESCSDDSDVDGSWHDVSSDEEGKQEEEEVLTKEEKVAKSQLVSQGRLLTQEEFRLVKAKQISKELVAAPRKSALKRKIAAVVDDTEGNENGELVSLGSIELVHKKKPHDRESRMANTLASREDRGKTAPRRTKLNPFASTSNKEKLKKKPFMMVKQKMRKKKSGRSFQEKQRDLRAALLKRAKSYKF